MLLKAFSAALVSGAMLSLLLPAGVSHASFGQQVLRYGSSDRSDIQVLQVRLRDLGYPINVDGVYGLQTVAAVEAFQRLHDIQPTGVVAGQTFHEFAVLAHGVSRGSDPRGSLYVVQAGDTLSSIASQEGVPLSALETANPSISAGTLQVGQTVVIPSASAVATTQGPSASAFGAELAALAPKYLGVPYVYGGASPAGFDCSGFVWYLAHLLGVTLPRTASGQYETGTAVSRDDLLPGDLVFFDTEGYASHVGIYVGGGDFIQAETSGTSVMYTSLDSGYWADTYLGARRIFAN